MQDKKLLAVGAQHGANQIYKKFNGHIDIVKKVLDVAKLSPEQELFTISDVEAILHSLTKAFAKDITIANAMYNIEIDTLSGNDPYEGNA